MKRLHVLFALTTIVGSAVAMVAQQRPAPGPQPPVPLEKLKLPSGFHISVYVDNARGAREMAIGAKGTVFVGSMDPGVVYAIVEHNGVREAKVIASGLQQPSGIAFRNGSLYVAAGPKIVRLDDIEAKIDAPPMPVVVIDGLPAKYHSWKFLAFGPDGLMYVSIGSPCNVCEDEIIKDPRNATIMRMKPDGSNPEIFAHGVRNSVGFDWSPTTHEMWFSDNGRDNLGDDIPSDELNIAPKAGMNFGFPYCNQGDLKDPDFGDKHPCSDFTPPVLKVGPHVASIGLQFYTGKMFPPEYQGSIFVAQHGSWNRSVPIGYRVMSVKISGSKVLSYDTFVDGFLHGVRGNPPADQASNPLARTNGDSYARPAAVLMLPDGSLLISDDTGPTGRGGGRIFRVTYGNAK